MAKKNGKTEKISEMKTESAAEPESTELDRTEVRSESTLSDLGTQEETTDSSAEEQTPLAIEDASSEDLLDDIRQSLIEEDETEKNKKKSKWWSRVGRKEKSAEPEASLPIVEIDMPPTSLQTHLPEDQKPVIESEEYEAEIDDLIDMLEAEDGQAPAETSSVAPATEIPPEPEPEIDFEQLKEQAFRPRRAEEFESDSEVRSIALEGGEEVFVEVEARTADPFDERIKSLENALKPYRSYIYMTFAFLGVVMAVMASFLIYNAYQKARPQPVKEASNTPYPVAVSLPGGWSFNLGRGTLQNGAWEPGGAEWLEGTEVCRWVSLPWSRQLEAVLRTLNPKDSIELVMSNNDKITYSVYSVYEMTLEEIQNVDANTPCLLIILTGSDSEKRWVLTALP
jgi:hypothetical protein